MSTSPTPRPHRRVRSVPIQLNFQLTPLTTSRSKSIFIPTSGTSTPSPSDTPQDIIQPRKRRIHSRRSSGTHSPAHPTSAAYEDHPSIEIKRSSSTFFLSSLPSYRHDWTYRQGARVTAESLEEQGRSWLVSRASSTDLVGQTRLEESDSEDEDIYHRHTRDLEILELGETLLGTREDEDDEEEEFNWTRWVRTFMDFGEESDGEEMEWRPPRRRMVAFAEGTMRKKIDENVVQRARERDEEHGLDGWMDGAAYLAFLGVRALGGFF